MIIVVIIGIAISFFMRPKSIPYEKTQAKTKDITTYYHFSGNVDAKNRQVVMADSILQVSEILVKKGDVVEEGDILLRTTTGAEIKSKINGEVSHIKVKKDQQVMAGTELLEVVDYNDLQINAKVDEYDINAIREGTEVVADIGAIDKKIKGSIEDVSKEGQIENGVTFFTASIDLEEDKDVKIGMSAEVKLISDKVSDVVTLPMEAIQFDNHNKPYVLKMNDQGEIVKREIKTGIHDGTLVEIKKGVSNGETVYYRTNTPLNFMKNPITNINRAPINANNKTTQDGGLN